MDPQTTFDNWLSAKGEDRLGPARAYNDWRDSGGFAAKHNGKDVDMLLLSTRHDTNCIIYTDTTTIIDLLEQ